MIPELFFSDINPKINLYKELLLSPITNYFSQQNRDAHQNTRLSFPLEISLQATARGFESHRLRQKIISTHFVWRLFFRWDSNPERVSSEQKTVRWTVFRCEVRSGYAARTGDARHMPQRHHPTVSAKKGRVFATRPFSYFPAHNHGQTSHSKLRYNCSAERNAL